MDNSDESCKVNKSKSFNEALKYIKDRQREKTGQGTYIITEYESDYIEAKIYKPEALPNVHFKSVNRITIVYQDGTQTKFAKI